VEALASSVEALDERDVRTLDRAAELLERIASG
jgi:hypothetical protein